VLLSHTYNHTDMNALSDAAKIDEVRHNEAVFDAIGAPFTFKGIRTPFGSANTHTQEVVASLGYTYFLTRIETGNDYEPATTTQQTVDGIVSRLRPGAIIGLHDGPIDTPAGLATSTRCRRSSTARGRSATASARSIAPARWSATATCSSDAPIPQMTNPVPYNFLERAGTPPAQWFVAPDGAGHRRVALRRVGARRQRDIVGGRHEPARHAERSRPGGRLDGDRHRRDPAGADGHVVGRSGLDVHGRHTRTCRRTDTLAPHAAYPPIKINVNVSATAGLVLTNTPKYVAHGQGWANIDTDRSRRRAGRRDVSGTVPATLSLTLGRPARSGVHAGRVRRTTRRRRPPWSRRRPATRRCRSPGRTTSATARSHSRRR
jgi:hypothetical protein